MERLIKSKPNGHYQQIVPPGTMRFLDFGRLQLRKGERYSGATGSRESVLDFFSGTASVTIASGGGRKQSFDKVGGRTELFSTAPVMVYIPPQATYEIISVSDALDVGIFSAPSQCSAQPALLEGSAVIARIVGRDNWRRTVYSALGENVPAERLLAGKL